MSSFIQQIKENESGLSLFELTIVVFILLMLLLSTVLLLQPAERRKKGKDERRLSDISAIDRAINEYLVDYGNYPDSEDVTRTSTSLPSGSPGPLSSSSTGWINQDLSSYISRLPLDPDNDDTYFYSYRHTQNAYELNARLEILTEYSNNASDGGDENDIYEIGNDLTIL